MADNPIQGFQQITSIALRQVTQREFPVFFQLTREVEVMDSQGTVPRPTFALYSCERLRSKPTILALPTPKIGNLVYKCKFNLTNFTFVKW